MKKTIRFSAILLIFALMLPALLSCSQDSEIPDGFQDATCDGEYFRFFVPTQWNLNTESGISSAYFSMEKNIGVSLAASEKIGKLEDGSDEKLEDFCAGCIEKYKSSMTKFELIKDGVPAVMGGKPSRAYTFSAVIDGQVFKYYQVMCAHRDHFYVFNYTSPIDEFEKNEAIVDEIVENVLFFNTPYEAKNIRETEIDKDTPDGMVRVSDNRVAYRFYAPKNWKIDRNMGQCSVYFSDEDRSNVNVVAYMPATDDVKLADYCDSCIESYKGLFGDFALVSRSEENELKADGHEAVRMVYTASDGDVSYKFDQTVVSYGSMFYLITYTAKTENFDLHTDDLQKMIDTFKFR